MGGHGALTLALRHPGLFKSLSAFAPICAPTQCPWGRKRSLAISVPIAHCGASTTPASSWRAAAAPFPDGILIDQGPRRQNFLEAQLHPHLFEHACAAVKQPLTLRRHAGYDHGYYFISTFINDHLDHHAHPAARLIAPATTHDHQTTCHPAHSSGARRPRRLPLAGAGTERPPPCCSRTSTSGRTAPASTNRSTYGTSGTPTTRDLQNRLAEWGSWRVCRGVVPSGTGGGGHTHFCPSCAWRPRLIPANVYDPVKTLANGLLKRMNVTVEQYDPLVGAGIRHRSSRTPGWCGWKRPVPSRWK